MCKDCGCSITHHDEKPEIKTTQVIKNILDKNDEQARHNREHFEEHGVFAINIMSSPGAGKTSFLESTIDLLQGYKIAVIEGDLETDNDAQRIRNKGVPAVQITTGQACHLDAFMVHKALHELSLDNLDILFIENVGNLVCPASYDIGTHLNVVMLSVVEGEDKPEKYPVMFSIADILIINKLDLAPYVDFDMKKMIKSAKKVKPNIDIIALSSKTKEGFSDWIDYLNLKLSLYKKSYA